MKHKWKPNNYYRGPYFWPGSQYCTVCFETWAAPCDPLDSEGAAKYMKKQYAREDCPGTRKEPNEKT